MTDEQPEALRLANDVDEVARVYPDMAEVSAELRRQHAEIETLHINAERYRYLRERDLSAISQGGVFAGKVPENVVLNGDDLDAYIDGELAQSKGVK